MSRSLPVSLALLAIPAAAFAQDFSGTYRLAAAGAAPITITLRQNAAGQVTGTLTGNTAFQIQGQVQNGQLAAYASNRNGRLYLEAAVAGAQLQVAMAEVGPDGQPQAQTARTLVFDRVGGMGQAAPQGGRLLGRGAAPQAPGAPGMAMAPAGPQAGPPGVGPASPQDRQISQLLLRSPWCSFHYNQNTGTSSQERAVFRADGTGSLGTGGETYNSGAAGTVSSQRSGGQQFRWMVRGGALISSTDGVQWSRTPLQVTQNSNGYPIITGDGKEYSMCN
jgi:hypothetical protein